MDLKDFIRETLKSVIEATDEIAREYESSKIIINPPVSDRDRSLYLGESTSHIHRRVEEVTFDVAVTATAETGGGVNTGLRVFSAEVNAGASHERQREEVSRVKFVIPIVLSPSRAEVENRQLERQQKDEFEQQRKTRRKNLGGMAN